MGEWQTVFDSGVCAPSGMTVRIACVPILGDTVCTDSYRG
jgi:hypothetical protein